MSAVYRPRMLQIYVHGLDLVVSGLNRVTGALQHTLPGLIDRLTARHPRVSIQLVAGNIEAMHRDLLDRRIDILIGWKVGPLADARLAFEVLFDDSHVVVAGKANRWGKRRKVTLDELMDEPWVLPAPDSFIGTVIMQAFRAHGLDWPRSTVLTFPHDVRVRLLATGRFLTIFRDSVVRFSAISARFFNRGAVGFVITDFWQNCVHGMRRCLSQVSPKHK